VGVGAEVGAEAASWASPAAAASLSCCWLGWRGHGEGCVTCHLVPIGLRFEK
jgi:hypothetical protein